MKRRAMIWVILALMLTAWALASCAPHVDEIVGSWRVVSSESDIFSPGMVFEFTSDRDVHISVGTAAWTEEQRQTFEDASADIDMTYTINANGDFRLTLDRGAQGSNIVRMHYELNDDVLTITDAEGLTLTFRRM